MATNRHTLIDELRQLVDDIESNNYVAQRLYDGAVKCNLYDFKNIHGEENIEVVKACESKKVSCIEQIIRKPSIASPITQYKHMVDLLSNILSKSLNLVGSLKESMRCLWIIRPISNHSAIDYDVKQIEKKSSCKIVDKTILVVGESCILEENTNTKCHENNQSPPLKIKSINSSSTPAFSGTKAFITSTLSEIIFKQQNSQEIINKGNEFIKRKISLIKHELEELKSHDSIKECEEQDNYTCTCKCHQHITCSSERHNTEYQNIIKTNRLLDRKQVLSKSHDSIKKCSGHSFSNIISKNDCTQQHFNYCSKQSTGVNSKSKNEMEECFNLIELANFSNHNLVLSKCNINFLNTIEEKEIIENTVEPLEYGLACMDSYELGSMGDTEENL